MAMNLAPTAAGPGRVTSIVLFAPHHTAPLRDVRAHGRRDGYSKARKPFEGRRRRASDRRRDDIGNVGLPSTEAWWEEPGQQHQRTEASPQHSQQDRNRPVTEEDDEGQGWWQKPEERSLQAYAPGELSAHQVKRLEEAFAQGRRKVKVQELAQELDLDRTEVLHWMKQFSLRPDSERQVIVNQRKEDMRLAAESAKNEPRPVMQAAASAPLQKPQEQQGFIPFFTRKEMGLVDFRHRRLSADATRTLEAIYSRTPFPPDDVIKGMWDLHKVNRETTLQWLTARREQDGIASKQSKRQKDETELSPAQLRQAMGSVGFDSTNLMSKVMGGEAPAPEQPHTVVVSVTGRQLAMLKSALPSPNKHKGRARNEKMGIKHDGDSLQVGSIQYVKEQADPNATNRWTAKWRIKKAAQVRRVLPLLMNKE